jgi:hypothetical protein
MEEEFSSDEAAGPNGLNRLAKFVLRRIDPYLRNRPVRQGVAGIRQQIPR